MPNQIICNKESCNNVKGNNSLKDYEVKVLIDKKFTKFSTSSFLMYKTFLVR